LRARLSVRDVRLAGDGDHVVGRTVAVRVPVVVGLE